MDEQGAIDSPDNLGDTPLHLAACRGHCEIVLALLNRCETGHTCGKQYNLHSLPTHCQQLSEAQHKFARSGPPMIN